MYNAVGRWALSLALAAISAERRGLTNKRRDAVPYDVRDIPHLLYPAFPSQGEVKRACRTTTEQMAATKLCGLPREARARMAAGRRRRRRSAWIPR
jgi:hypothetical protein